MKLGKVPAFLGALARAHNKVIDGLQAGRGIRISKSKGNILIENTAPATIGGGAEGAATSVVGSTGSLQLVPKHSTWVDPDTSPVYPTSLRAVDGGATNRMDSAGIVSTGAGLDFQHDPVGGEGGWYVGAISVVVNGSGELVINNGSNTLTIDPALITHNMSIRAIDVCDSGTPKSMLVIGSAPY